MTDRVISMKFTVRCEDLELTPKRASSHFLDDDSWLIEVLRREQEIFFVSFLFNLVLWKYNLCKVFLQFYFLTFISWRSLQG